MRAPLRRMAVAVIVLFALLLLNINYVQVVEAGSLNKNPHNSRVIIQAYARQRGPIVAGGQDVARSIPTTGTLKYLRVYPGGPAYAPVTGFDSLVYGLSGIEAAENSILTGTSSQLFSQRLSDLLAGRPQQGGAVVLTINPAAQQAAYAGLAGRKGAVVAIDPRTGAILALVSSPSYNPSVLSTHSVAGIQAAYHQLLTDPSKPMLDRAISNTYPPGSVFKIVTTAAALSSGRYTPTSQIPSPTVLKLPQTTKTLHNFQGESCGNGQTDSLQNAFQISCDTAYAGLGMALGGPALQREAQLFGIGSGLSIPLPVVASGFPRTLSPPTTAYSAIGQYNVRLTPLQAAMLAATVANHGTLMAPYLVKELKAPNLATVSVTQPKVIRQVMSPAVADQINAMMQLVVQAGTGTAAQIPGVAVAGKTGTAQNAPGQPPHAWFAAFAPAQAPQVAVAVLVENAGVGGSVAAPIARSVIQAVLHG